MPLYDCVMLLKPHVKKEAAVDLIARVGKHVIARNGVITDIKAFQQIELGYGIKKLDGRYYQGQLMQMTMMATPNINKELHYLNKEDRLLRWILVKHRETKFGTHHAKNFRIDPSMFPLSTSPFGPIGDDDIKMAESGRRRINTEGDGEIGGDDDYDEYEVEKSVSEKTEA